MKIVEKKTNGENLIEKLRFNTHVESVSEINEKQATEIIYAKSGERYFDLVSDNEKIVKAAEWSADLDYTLPPECGLLKGKVYLNYPLSVIVEVEVEVKSNGSLLWQIAKAYEKIYKWEEATTDVDVVPIEERPDSDQCFSLLNRNSTNGDYGI